MSLDGHGTAPRASISARLRAISHYLIARVFRFWSVVSPPSDQKPIRAELFSIERLEQHAESLAAAQRVTSEHASDRQLERRLRDNDRVLRSAYHAIIAGAREQHTMTAAAD